MTKNELIINVLEDLGLRPHVDEDGDVVFRYQLKCFVVIVGKESEQFLTLMLPKFYEITEGEEHIALAACNKMTRDLKLAKVFVDSNLKKVSATCEFFYSDEESMKFSIENSLKMLGVIKTRFRIVHKEFIE